MQSKGIARQVQYNKQSAKSLDVQRIVEVKSMSNMERTTGIPLGSKWTQADDERLTRAVGQYGVSNWAKVAKCFPVKRTAPQCMTRWTQILARAANTKEPRKGTWSSDEDDLLRNLMEAMPHRNWGDVAALIPGRSAKQCRERWCYNLDPTIKKDVWTSEEDKVLLENQQKLGNRWAFIASMLPGRTENAVKTRFKSIMRAKRREWHSDEDKTIMEMHRQVGSKWDKIAEKLPNRTKNAVRTRYRQLIKEAKGIQEAPNEFGNYGKRAAMLRKCNELQKQLEVEKLLLQLGEYCINDAEKKKINKQSNGSIDVESKQHIPNELPIYPSSIVKSEFKQRNIATKNGNTNFQPANQPTVYTTSLKDDSTEKRPRSRRGSKRSYSGVDHHPDYESKFSEQPSPQKNIPTGNCIHTTPVQQYYKQQIASNQPDTGALWAVTAAADTLDKSDTSRIRNTNALTSSPLQNFQSLEQQQNKQPVKKKRRPSVPESELSAIKSLRNIASSPVVCD